MLREDCLGSFFSVCAFGLAARCSHPRCELLDSTNERGAMPRALLLYDATCRFCTATARRAKWLVPGDALRLADVNDPRRQARYGVTPAAAQAAMHLVRRGGRISNGAEAVRAL